MIRSLVVIAWLVIASWAGPLVAAEPTAPVGMGELQSLSVQPQNPRLRGGHAVQQLVVTGHYTNGGVRDLTTTCTLSAADPALVYVEAGGLLAALKNGSTTITATAQGKSVQVPVVVEGTEREEPVNFTNEVVPIFSKLGCNAGACHGKASGQNGFKLSLLGFEPNVDYEAITREARGRRVFPAMPEASLLLLKSTGNVAHGGGKRLEPTSRDYQTLLRWIQSGTPFGLNTDPKVVGITVAPAHRLIAPKSRQQITVTARYSDGSSRDVTTGAEYTSNDTEVVGVSERGVVETRDIPGDGSIMVRYLGNVAVFRATVPLNTPAEKVALPAPANFIDEHVFAKLRQLNLPPSAPCTDGEFLRRVSLDITGTLPTTVEVEKFLSEKDPRKRAKLVDALLERPEYASYFTLKWGDILRNRRSGVVGLGGGAARTTAFHRWIHDSVSKNTPYDQFVRAIITAKGSVIGAGGQPPVGWYHVLKTPSLLADDTAQVFLGTRIQCAQCHHHPYEKWSQDDYWGLAAFYARVQMTTIKADVPKDGRGLMTLSINNDGKVINPQGKVYTRPRPLDGEELTLSPAEDPRVKLAEWMTHPDNPFLARALVNRYWAHFLGRGIVEMADDLRVTNPPSNPTLLDALARDFVAQKFDLKQLIRTICTSKTYQLSSTPNEFNGKDRQNFARFYPRRLPAEVLVDAFDRLADLPARFVNKDGRGGAARTDAKRAIELPDESVMTPMLAAFGKPERTSGCECERSGAATLNQSLLLIGSTEVQNKLKDKNSRAAKLVADPRPTADKVREVYLLAFSRLPTAEELKIAEEFLAKPVAVPAELPKQQASTLKQWPYEDFLWALMNTKEFLFNH